MKYSCTQVYEGDDETHPLDIQPIGFSSLQQIPRNTHVYLHLHVGPKDEMGRILTYVDAQTNHVREFHVSDVLKKKMFKKDGKALCKDGFHSLLIEMENAELGR